VGEVEEAVELSRLPRKRGSVMSMDGLRLSDQLSLVYSGSADLRTLKATACGAATLGFAALLSSAAISWCNISTRFHANFIVLRFIK